MFTRQHLRSSGLRIVAAALAASLAVSACSSGSGSGGGGATTAPSGKVSTTTGAVQTSSVAVYPLAYVNGTPPRGTSNRVDVKVAPSADQKLRVTFSEDEVSGTGDQWRAAAWSAVTVGTLLNGSPLRGKEFTFQLRGGIDGPSAGTLMTIAVIALLRGDKIKDDITMTGTINPDGTVGPVGGLPYKIEGAAQAGKKRMLIPLGQRNSKDDAGNTVDIVQAARAKNIDVQEVGDIYQAYQQFTGVALPRPGQTGPVRLSERAYQTLKAKADEYIAAVKSDAADINSLPRPVQQALGGFLTQANTYIAKAVRLQGQGLQAGAFSSAAQAALLSGAALRTGRLILTYSNQGRAAFLTQLNGSVVINDNVRALFETLKAFTPESVADISALVAAYANGTDALSLAKYGDNVLSGLKKASSAEAEFQIALSGAFLKEASLQIVRYAKSIFEVGRGLGGARLGGSEDIAGTADFFRKAAEANLTAFNTVVVNSLADEANISRAEASVRIQGNDLQYALANSSVDVVENGIARFLEPGAASYAKLGASVLLYVRSEALLEKYYSFDAQVDNSGTVVAVQFEQSLSNALDLAKSQAERSASLLTSRNIDPTIEIGAYEIAGIEREGTLDDKLLALNDYRTAFLTSRVIAYIAGFAGAGFE